MTLNMLKNNVVKLIGVIASDLEFSHELYGEIFYESFIEIPRLSDTKDVLPITISERLLMDGGVIKGDRVEIEGQFRSYNRSSDDGKNHLILTVFVRDIRRLNVEDKVLNPNEIFLDGYICKKPIYRKTPFGREISDILIAVNRAYNKSDYIPCIAWGRNARFADKLKVGDHVKLWGRIQSREYIKRISENESVKKTAYEVSISKIQKSE